MGYPSLDFHSEHGNQFSPDHVQGGIELHRFLLLRDLISDKVIYDIDMYCLLTT